MKKRLEDVDAANYDAALARRDAGDLVGAIKMLEALAAKLPSDAMVVGMLAGLLYSNHDFSEALPHARRAVELAPKSELGSRILFHVLIRLGDVGGAFVEVARFRSSRHSPEYERILGEFEEGTLKDLKLRPFDPFLTESLRRVREEMHVRPVKQ